LGLSAKQIREYSPSLADIVALRADEGVASIANRILSIASPKRNHPAPIYSADNTENARKAIQTLRELICHGMQLTIDHAPRILVYFAIERDSETVLVSLASSMPQQPSISFPAKHSIAGWALHREDMVVLDSIETDRAYDRLLSLPQMSSEMCAPIFRSHDRTKAIGIITLESEHSHFFSNAQHRSFFSSFIAVAQLVLSPLVEAHLQGVEKVGL
jgi:hypothetical protein